MVHRSARGQGLGRRLLAITEEAAASAGSTLLHLASETGSPAEHLYRTIGWIRAGTVPDYPADPSRCPARHHPYCKRLGSSPA